MREQGQDTTQRMKPVRGEHPVTASQDTVPSKAITRKNPVVHAHTQPQAALPELPRQPETAERDPYQTISYDELDRLLKMAEEAKPIEHLDAAEPIERPQEAQVVRDSTLDLEGYLFSVKTLAERKAEQEAIERGKEHTQAIMTHRISLGKQDEDMSVDERVAQTLRVAQEKHLLPVPIQTLIKVLLTIEKFKEKRKEYEPVAKTLKQRSAKAWWFWHMVSEGKERVEEKRKRGIVGKSGCWFADVAIKEPIPIGLQDQLVRTCARTLHGMIHAHQNTQAELLALHDQLVKRHNTEIIYQKQKDHRAIEPYEQRLNPNNSVLPPENWLEYVAQMGKKDWGVYFSQETRALAYRTPQEMQTVAIYMQDRTFYLPITSPAQTERDLEIQLYRMIQQPDRVVGQPVAHPVLELHFSTSSQSQEQALALQALASTSPACKVVLNQDRDSCIDKVLWEFPHLLANGRDGLKIVQEVEKTLNVETTVKIDELTRPSIIHKKIGKKKTYRAKDGKKVQTNVEEVEAVSGIELTPSENDLLYATQEYLKKKVPPVKAYTAELIAIAQNFITPEGTYICVSPENNDLQLTEVPSGQTQDLRTSFIRWRDIIAKLHKEHGISLDSIEAWKTESPENARLYAELVGAFATQFEDTTKLVLSDTNECRNGRGMLSILETYISSLSRSALRSIVPSASKVLEQARAQVSFVSLKEPGKIRFVSALSANVKTAIGGFSCPDETGKLSRVLTIRQRTEQQDIQTLIQTYDGSLNGTDQEVLNLVALDTQKRLLALRRNIALLCLFVASAYPGNEPKIRDIEAKFASSWNTILSDQSKYIPVI